jgi:hypothetical protein
MDGRSKVSKFISCGQFYRAGGLAQTKRSTGATSLGNSWHEKGAKSGRSLFETHPRSAMISAMSTEKSSEDRLRQRVIQEAGLVAKAVQLDEAERRVRELEVRIFTSHTQTMTWILTAISAVMGLAAVIVTILAYLSKSETGQELKDIRQQADRETDRLERRFDQMKADFQQQFSAFAGDALKRPRVEISISGGPLNNQVLHMKRGQGPPLYQGQVPFFPLFLKNAGQKRTDPLSIYLCCSQRLGWSGNGMWMPDMSNDPEYPYRYRCQYPKLSPLSTVGLSPGESTTVDGDWTDYREFNWDVSTNTLWCRLQVFYGGESPSEARFQVKNAP